MVKKTKSKTKKGPVRPKPLSPKSGISKNEFGKGGCIKRKS